MEIVLCGQCGYILHKGEELATPRDVARRYNGRCPRCMSPLNTRGVRIEVLARPRR